MKKLAGEFIPSQETIIRTAENLTLPEVYKKPLMVAFYLTFDCNARCEFCSQANFVYGEERGTYAHMRRDVDRAKQILRVIREDVPSIYFEGGEPTIYPGFAEVLEESARLQFDIIGVNTNAIRFRPEILEYANLIVVSLHSDDPRKIESIYKINGHMEVGAEVIDNVCDYANKRDKKRTRMVINCVATKDNLADVAEVARMARNLGVEFNLAPAIGPDGKPDSALINNPDYTAFIDWMLKQKGLIATSQHYLRTIRDFSPFTCAPHLIPGIHPDGSMIVPCPNLASKPEMVNILEVGGVTKALRIGRERFETKNGVLDTQRQCRDRCHKACYIETSSVSSPDSLVAMIRNRLRGPRKGPHIIDPEYNPPHLTPHSLYICDPYYDKFAPWMGEGWLERKEQCPASANAAKKSASRLPIIQE